MDRYLTPTSILNYENATIQRLLVRKGWHQLPEYDAVGAIYNFVRDEIRFGYNRSDDIPASAVLDDGYGQCNTKGTLLMALLRAAGIPCRFHGFTIYNALQAGAIPHYLMWLAPERIIHSWVEVWHRDSWIKLEGFILDSDYLQQIQRSFHEQSGNFSGYGIATGCLANPQVDWCGGDTFIQSEGIADDYGIFDCPDEFYLAHGTNLAGVKRLLYQYGIRHLINRHVQRIRANGLPTAITAAS